MLPSHDLSCAFIFDNIYEFLKVLCPGVHLGNSQTFLWGRYTILVFCIVCVFLMRIGCVGFLYCIFWCESFCCFCRMELCYCFWCFSSLIKFRSTMRRWHINPSDTQCWFCIWGTGWFQFNDKQESMWVGQITVSALAGVQAMLPKLFLGLCGVGGLGIGTFTRLGDASAVWLRIGDSAGRWSPCKSPQWMVTQMFFLS